MTATNSGFLFKMSHKKSYFLVSNFQISKCYVIFILIFFSTYKISQLYKKNYPGAYKTILSVIGKVLDRFSLVPYQLVVSDFSI